jgi:uncharacterized membrane protein YfcA
MNKVYRYWLLAISYWLLAIGKEITLTPGARPPMELLFLAIGLSAGVLSGLFGIGGGILIVPTLIFFAKFPAKLALGTSLGALLLPVGLLGAYTYYKSGNLDIRASLLVALGLFFGAWGGARLAQVLPAATLQRMFAVFIALMAVRLWMDAGKGA